MTQQRQRRFCLMASVVLMGALAGCHDHASVVQPKAPVDLPEPTGTFVHRFEALQTDKARATQFVFFLDEWYMGGTMLGPHGARHLHLIIDRLPKSATLVQIQPSPEPALNEQRRQVLVAALREGGVADAEWRVVIGFPQAEDLDAEEAERIYRQMLRSPGLNNGGALGSPYGGALGSPYGANSGVGSPGGGAFGVFGRPVGY